MGNYCLKEDNHKNMYTEMDSKFADQEQHFCRKATFKPPSRMQRETWRKIMHIGSTCFGQMRQNERSLAADRFNAILFNANSHQKVVALYLTYRDAAYVWRKKGEVHNRKLLV